MATDSIANCRQPAYTYLRQGASALGVSHVNNRRTTFQSYEYGQVVAPRRNLCRRYRAGTPVAARLVNRRAQPRSPDAAKPGGCLAPRPEIDCQPRVRPVMRCGPPSRWPTALLTFVGFAPLVQPCQLTGKRLDLRIDSQSRHRARPSPRAATH